MRKKKGVGDENIRISYLDFFFFFNFFFFFLKNVPYLTLI